MTISGTRIPSESSTQLKRLLMGKQKMVVKVTMKDEKQRRKAMKIAAGMPGVISTTREEERIVVVSDGLDPVKLAVTLKKKMGFAELVSVGAAEEKKQEAKKQEPKKADEAKSLQPATYPYETVVWPPYPYENCHEPCCFIM